MEEKKMNWKEEAELYGIKSAFRKKEDVLKDIEDVKAGKITVKEESVKTKTSTLKDRMKAMLSSDVSKIKTHFLYRIRWEKMSINQKKEFLKKTLSTQYPFGWEIVDDKIKVYLSESKKKYILSDKL